MASATRGRRRLARPAAALAAMLAVGSLLTVAPADGRPQATHLTELPRLTRIYDAIFDARFGDAADGLARSCAPAPPVACDLLAASALWWQIQMDPANSARDAELRARIEASLDTAGDWTRREPQRAEAWFYLGAAYGVRAQLQVLRNEKLAAARDGKRIRDALERALALDPGLGDAHFGIGMYKYYAAMAPAVLRLLRWLLFLPGGNRAEGLAEMRQARRESELLRPEATYQLHLIDVWYEQQPGEALELLAELRTAYPHNPLFYVRVAEVHDFYRHDRAAALATYRALLDAALARRVELAAQAEVWARLGIARQLDGSGETPGAIAQLEAVIARRPAEPYGALAVAHLALGQAEERLGHRARAIASYEAARASAPPGDPDRIRERAAKALARLSGKDR